VKVDSLSSPTLLSEERREFWFYLEGQEIRVLNSRAFQNEIKLEQQHP
jgi:hypothetical protein